MARTVTRLTGEQQQLLEDVVDAAAARRAAEDRYEAAMLAADDGAVPVAHIARALQMKHESVRLYLKRRKTESHGAL